jgi:uncharacterized protein (TIGR03086 family)
MSLTTLYDRTVETWTDRIGAIGAEQWEAPTPCSAWSVRELVNHVVGEDRWTDPLMRGRTIAEVGASLDGDLLGDDPVRSALDAAAEAVSAVGELLPAGGVVHLSYGEEQKAEYVHQLTADHLIHAWDLARAIGADERLDAGLVASCASWFEAMEDAYRSAGAIAARPPVPGHADAQTLLLARFGRRA